jgi:hypothetical protein
MNVNIIGAELSQEEIQAYIEYGKQKYPDREIVGITIKADGEYVDLKYDFKPDVPFNRIRRITGYLVGTLDRFCDGKKAEEHDRVKHTV